MLRRGSGAVNAMACAPLDAGRVPRVNLVTCGRLPHRPQWRFIVPLRPQSSLHAEGQAMKSRHMSTMHTASHRRPWHYLPWLGVLLLLLCAAAAASAQESADPPGRVAVVTFRQGSVVYAPQGDDEWVDLPENRPLTGGDRLWTDDGARAELQLGTATLHMDSETHLGLSDVDERAAQFILQQGTINARVRDLASGENFEIGTPNLAFRALQPGDYRIDVDPQTGETRVTVQSGVAQLFGEGGSRTIQMGAGQQLSFAGRSLAQVQQASYQLDDFSLWAAERNRQEDQSIAARHVPRGVVGYSELDSYGQWAQDPTYGEVWYPQVPVADWAPYRYGHWDWIAPWGWTWIDDAPWGFAPFHYGRWTQIDNRWAWVPGRMTVRPVYAPALVDFMGGDASYEIAGSPAVGWYPLAPGEAWYPVYATSPAYISFVNFNINLRSQPRGHHNHFWRHRSFAVTAMGQDDFRHGRAADRHRQPVHPGFLGSAQVGVVPGRPDPRWRRAAEFQQHGGRQAPVHSGAAGLATLPRQFQGSRDAAPAVREQFRAQQEQHRLQRDAERAARDQQRQQDVLRQQGDTRLQREQLLRQQQEHAGRIGGNRTRPGVVQAPQADRAEREAWLRQRQQERALRQAQPGGFQQQQRVQPIMQPRQMAPAQPMRVMPQRQIQAAPERAPRFVPQQQQQPQQPAPIGRNPGGWQQRDGDAGGGGFREGGHGGGGHWHR
jgi:hypothetical protein